MARKAQSPWGMAGAEMLQMKHSTIQYPLGKSMDYRKITISMDYRKWIIVNYNNIYHINGL